MTESEEAAYMRGAREALDLAIGHVEALAAAQRVKRAHFAAKATSEVARVLRRVHGDVVRHTSDNLIVREAID